MITKKSATTEEIIEAQKPVEEKMQEDNKLAVLPQSSVALFNPEEDTVQGKKAADQLNDIIKNNKKSLVITIGQGECIKFEAWQTLAKYYHCSAKTEWV